MGLESAFVIALLIGVLSFYWIILRSSSKKIFDQYKKLAETFEIELNQPSSKLKGFIRPEPSVYGQYRGREISISVPGKGLQNTRQVESVLKLGHANNSIRAQLTATGPLGALRQRDSGKQSRWKSGDEVFDSAVDVRTNQGDKLSVLFSAEQRAWLAETLNQSKATLYMGGGMLAYAKLGLISNESARKEFESVANFLCDLAESIENN